MLVRMCPYCDHEMTKRHHCDFCNSFVWKAETMDIHFNTESRGKHEADCAYGAEHDKVHHHGMEETRKPDKSKDTKGRPASGKGGSGNGGGSALKGIGVVLAAVIIFLAPQISSLITEIVDHVSELNSGQDVTVSDGDSTPSTVAYVELEEADIAGYREHCNGYNHMPLTGEALFSMSQQFLEENYPGEIYETRKIFQGYEMTDGSGKILYENAYYIELDKSMSQYMVVCADAVTDEVHSVTIQMSDASYIRNYLELLLKDKAGISGLTGHDLDQIFVLDDYGFFSGECGNYELLTHRRDSDDLYSVSVRYSPFPWNYSSLKDEVLVDSGQVMADGKECTARSHFNSGADAPAVIERIDHWLAESGHDDFDMEENEINRRQIYGQLADLEYPATDYSHEYHWSSEGAALTVNLSTDTYSGRLHAISADDFSREDVPGLMELVTFAMGSGDAGELARMCMDGCDTEGYCFLYVDGYELYMSLSGDSLYMEVSPLIAS